MWKLYQSDWVEAIIPHPSDKNREIFKYHEFQEGGNTFRWFYDRVKNSTSTACKDKKLYCVNCRNCITTTNDRDSHNCPKQKQQKLPEQSEDKILFQKYATSYEKDPTQIQALSLLIVDKNCSYSLADSEYIPKLLKAAKIVNIEQFYDTKVTECIKDMGWEKTAKNRQYYADIGARAVSMDSVDIGNKHYTIVVIHNALLLRNYMQDHPEAKIGDIDPRLKPTLLILTPDVSDGKSFCSLAYEIMDMFIEDGNALKIIVGDGLPVQYDTLYLTVKDNNLRSINPLFVGLPQYHLCFFHSISLAITHVRADNAVFQAFNLRMKKIIKILRRKGFQEYFKFKPRTLLKWRSLSTCDSMEDLIDLRLPLQTLLEADEPSLPKPHLAGFEVKNGLAGVDSEQLMCVISSMDDIDDVMQA